MRSFLSTNGTVWGDFGPGKYLGVINIFVTYTNLRTYSIALQITPSRQLPRIHKKYRNILFQTSSSCDKAIRKVGAARVLNTRGGTSPFSLSFFLLQLRDTRSIEPSIRTQCL
jgi:hypothetical protein